jgi:hypothetical protein
LTEMTVEERDARTVFCMQLSQRIRARDLEEFFSAVGKVIHFTCLSASINSFWKYYQVRDVRLITCNKTRRFKGLCYVEFAEPESVPLVTWFCLDKWTNFNQIFFFFFFFSHFSSIGDRIDRPKIMRRSNRCSTNSSRKEPTGRK